ncbi:hypothetical protein C8J57DRAFT_1251765 [Mycena rebaudengoi]|nr:hypothetical protein C8J57DRAFT_1251765 [Mycena rebaudengoi]
MRTPLGRVGRVGWSRTSQTSEGESDEPDERGIVRRETGTGQEGPCMYHGNGGRMEKTRLSQGTGFLSLGQFRKAQTQIRVFAHLNPCTLVELESGQAAEELVPPSSPPSPPSPPQAPPRSHNPVPPRSPPPALPPSPPQAPPQSPTPVTHPSPLLAPPRSPLPAHASTAPPANVKGKKRNAATAALDSVEAAADDSLRRGRRLRKSPQEAREERAQKAAGNRSKHSG